jgi:hypothetical protein
VLVGETLQFLVMVDGNMDRAALLAAIQRTFPDAVRRKENSCDLRGNWIEIWANESADATLAGGPDGYLYYQWRVEANPTDDSVDEDHQVELARALVRCFEELGARPVVAANFEDRV